MTFLKYLAIVTLALVNGINAILMFVVPEWYNIFAGIIVATSVPFFSAMVIIFGNENVH